MEDYKKKYEDALGRANAKIETYNHLGNASGVKSICEIFPELKESEDERVRKSIIDLVEKQMPKSENKKWMIAWLEKQGKKIDVIENFDTEFEKQVSHLVASTINKEYEYTSDFIKWTANTLLNYAKNELEKQSEQNPPDNVEPKFKVGDWIVRNNDTVIHKVVDIRPINDGGIYGYNLNDFTYFSGPFENEYHLWTIQDAKDGDVLCYRDEIFLLKYYNLYNKVCCHCCYSERFIPHNIHSFTREDFSKIHPATKEQRELLFQKMKEAGYEWDSEKKELKKIEQKTAWSEEDDYILNLVSKFTSKGYKSHPKIPSLEFVQDWLKSLKDRVQLQPKQEWSEEEKARIDKIIDVLDWAEEKGRISYSDWEDYVCYVKTLRPQNT